MTTSECIQKAQQDFEKAAAHLRDEYSRLQIGRASAALVENIHAEAYGTSQLLKALANISIPDPRTIAIQPWDRSVLPAIEKAIRDSDLGLNPVNDGIVVRLNIPALTEERRRDLTKVVHQFAEESKISIRNSRQVAHNTFKELKDKSEITEDDLHLSQKKLQDKVDAVNKQIDEMAKKKEEDVMKI